MLERIKHYFDDDRIVFVMSVNKEQLVHTISKYYGDSFAASDYLNKFFDIDLQLPSVNTRTYLQTLNIACDNNQWLTDIANSLQKYYKLSIRNTVLYFQKISMIMDKYYTGTQRDRDDRWLLLNMLIPIILVLDIINVSAKRKVLSGNGIDILLKIVEDNTILKEFIPYYAGNQEITEDNYQKGINEFQNVYKHVFSEDQGYEWYHKVVRIPAGLKETCIRMCNII